MRCQYLTLDSCCQIKAIFFCSAPFFKYPIMFVLEVLLSLNYIIVLSS